MRKYSFLVGMTICAALVCSTAQAASKATQFLFVQSAKSMSFSNNVLTLHDVAPLTIFFSDRPKRLAGHMRTSSFLSHWKKGANSFKKSPPNATLSIFSPGSTVAEVVVELTEPRLDGKNIAYKTKVLSGKLPTKGGESSLFIDSAGGACNVGDGSYSGEPCWAQTAFNCPSSGGC
jgi:hypothetical protein